MTLIGFNTDKYLHLNEARFSPLFVLGRAVRVRVRARVERSELRGQLGRVPQQPLHQRHLCRPGS